MFSTPVSLLERLRQPHEPTAWERFAELYAPLLFHWAKQLGQQESDAADLVQEVFLLLFQKLPRFQYNPTKSFHGWLRTVFLNRARERLRERISLPAAQPWHELADPASDRAEEEEYRQYLLHRALELIQREFSPLHLQAFRAYVLQDRSPTEVARELGLSPGMVYCIKSRILNRLRQDLRHLLD